MLSFAFHHLLKSPQAYRAAQKEVDEVCGKGPITVDHMPKLKYIAAVLRETLRLNPTASAFTVQSNGDKDFVLAGKYKISKDEPLILMLTQIQRDPKVFGEDAHQFKPERMLEGNFEKLPKNAWKVSSCSLGSQTQTDCL
jgi:cytochrome P450/NADPH-cytochrome P450 reductase